MISLPDEELDRREAVYTRRMSADEVARWLARPIAPDEVANVGALTRWFTRRYPTARERLAYARRAYARLVRTQETL
jgi:hypothetical protein